MIQVYFITDRHKLEHPLFGITEQELQVMNNLPKGVLPDIDPYGDTIFYIDHINFVCDNIQIMIENKELQFCYDKEYNLSFASDFSLSGGNRELVKGQFHCSDLFVV